MSGTKQQIKVNTQLKEPGLYQVVYLNDEKTSMDFVIQSLVKFFDYDETGAYDITMKIHEEGKAVVAVLPYEIAETRGSEVTYAARKSGFPLQVKIVSDE
jgi:ATP-dependent Clp protease adaptor protein ClpS